VQSNRYKPVEPADFSLNRWTGRFHANQWGFEFFQNYPSVHSGRPYLVRGTFGNWRLGLLAFPGALDWPSGLTEWEPWTKRFWRRRSCSRDAASRVTAASGGRPQRIGEDARYQRRGAPAPRLQRARIRRAAAVGVRAFVERGSRDSSSSFQGPSVQRSQLPSLQLFFKPSRLSMAAGEH